MTTRQNTSDPLSTLLVQEARSALLRLHSHLTEGSQSLSDSDHAAITRLLTQLGSLSTN